MASALVAQMSSQMAEGLDASRVVSARPGPARSMRSPTARPTVSHQRARGQLRQVTQVREQLVVLLGAHDLRHGAEPAHERLQACEVIGRRASPASGVSSQRTPVEQVGAREREPAARRAGQRVAADERQADGSSPAASTIARFVLPTSVTSTSASSTGGEPRAA